MLKSTTRRYMWNPLSWAMEVAMVVSIALLDYADFVLILALLIANAVIRCLPGKGNNAWGLHAFESVSWLRWQLSQGDGQ